MNKFTNGFAAVAAIIAVLLSIAAFNRSSKTIVLPANNANVGAISSPDLPFTNFSVGGFRRWAVKVPMNTATTSVCTIQTPNATTTLNAAFADFDNSTTSQAHIQLATAATSNATTTVLAQNTIPANIAYQLIATSTQSSRPVLAPLQWIVTKMAMQVGGTETTGTYSPSGYCGAEFIQYDY